MPTFTDGETEAWEGWVSFPRSHRRPVMESGFKAQAAWHRNLTSLSPLITEMESSSDRDASLGSKDTRPTELQPLFPSRTFSLYLHSILEHLWSSCFTLRQKDRSVFYFISSLLISLAFTVKSSDYSLYTLDPYFPLTSFPRKICMAHKGIFKSWQTIADVT